jgi:hypothetical protein
VGGDCVRLAQLCWQIDRADVAAAEVLTTFGHRIPPRPATWYAKQQRQQRARDALQAAKFRRVQRRIYRWYFAPIVARLEDAAERKAEEQAAIEDAGLIARLLIARAEDGAA